MNNQTQEQAVEATVVTNKNIKHFTSGSGQKYVFQKVPPVAWLDIMDKVDNNPERKRHTLYSEVLENIVVQPQLRLEDFTEYAELEEVVTEASRFQRGK